MPLSRPIISLVFFSNGAPHEMPPFNIPSGSKFPYKDFEMPWELPLGLITYELIIQNKGTSYLITSSIVQVDHYLNFAL